MKFPKKRIQIKSRSFSKNLSIEEPGMLGNLHPACDGICCEEMKSAIKDNIVITMITKEVKRAHNGKYLIRHRLYYDDDGMLKPFCICFFCHRPLTGFFVIGEIESIKEKRR